VINLFKARMSDDAGALVNEVLYSGYTGQGKQVEHFEDLLQLELNTKTRPVTVNSCTSAIDLALELCGLGVGDEVIATPATCWASNCNIINRGAKIIWADVIPDTSLIDPKSVKNKITEKTKAIISVNWGGNFCDFKTLKSFGIPVIEDAAHTWDVWKDFSHVERGDYICYSFQSIKYLQTADGGLLICPTKEIEDKARLLRWFGLDRTKGASFRCTQNIKYPGHKYQMNDVTAAIGISNIKVAKQSVISQRNNAKYLLANIKNDSLIIPEFNDDCSYWILSINAINLRKKQNFIDYCLENGIEVSPVHYRNDLYDCTKEFKCDLPGVDYFSDTQICIPNGWWLSNDDLSYIIETINTF